MTNNIAENAYRGSVIVPGSTTETVENRPLRLQDTVISNWQDQHMLFYGNVAFYIFEKPTNQVIEDHNDEVWSFLESIEDGWDEGKGKAPSREGLRWLRSSQLALLLQLHMDAPPPWNFQMEGPAVFPLTSGDIEFAWEENERSASLNVDLDTRQGTLHLFDNVAFESKHLNYYFSNNNSVLEIVEIVREVYNHLVSE